jgi:hypothetical protein
LPYRIEEFAIRAHQAAVQLAFDYAAAAILHRSRRNPIIQLFQQRRISQNQVLVCLRATKQPKQIRVNHGKYAS